MNLQYVEEKAAICTKCGLHKGRIKPVFAKGNPNADILIVGMVPGNTENEVGIPFVGDAGKILDEILEANALTLNDTYISNICKCALQPGIKLTQEWVMNCLPYLIVQIELVNPKVIVTLGADATNGLLGFPMNKAIGKSRKEQLYYTDNIPIVATYHPSFAKRQGGFKGKVKESFMEDFAKVKAALNRC